MAIVLAYHLHRLIILNIYQVLTYSCSVHHILFLRTKFASEFLDTATFRVKSGGESVLGVTLAVEILAYDIFVLLVVIASIRCIMAHRNIDSYHFVKVLAILGLNIATGERVTNLSVVQLSILILCLLEYIALTGPQSIVPHIIPIFYCAQLFLSCVVLTVT